MHENMKQVKSMDPSNFQSDTDSDSFIFQTDSDVCMSDHHHSGSNRNIGDIVSIAEPI